MSALILLSLPFALFVTFRSMTDGRVDDLVAGPMMIVYAIISVVAAARASFHPALDKRTRKAWRVLTAGLTMGVLSNFLFAALPGFPSPGDFVRLAEAPVLLVGLLMFPVRSRSAKDNQRLALDIGIVVSGGFVVLWYATLGPALIAEGHSAKIIAAAVAYPLADLVLIVAGSTALLRGVISRNRPLAIFVVALCCWVASDVQWSKNALASGGGTPSGGFLVWACLVSTFALVALAAVQQCRDASRHTLEEVVDRDVRPASLLPYLAVAIGFGVLLYVACREGLYPWGGMVVGAIIMTGCVMARQIVTLRENHTLVVSDHLTGLATRPRLHGAALDALASAKRSGVPMAVLVIDMDGFKAINDTLGHEAGDRVLVGFGELLRRTLSRTDTIARMGGDEFAVVLPAVGSLANATSVVKRLIAGMDEPVMVAGQPVSVRASIGIAMSDDHVTLAELLHHADLAMYTAKRRGAPGWAWHDDDTVSVGDAAGHATQ